MDLLRRAIELDGFEEGRHKEVLSNLVQAYGIHAGARTGIPPPARPGMGLHGDRLQRMHRQLFRFRPLRAGTSVQGFFRSALVDTFEPVMQEEGRHILFFVNWVAWHRRNLPFWRRPFFSAKVLAVWVFLIGERIGIARGVGGAGGAGSGTAPQDNNFTLTGSKAVGAVDLSAAATDRYLPRRERAAARRLRRRACCGPISCLG